MQQGKLRTQGCFQARSSEVRDLTICEMIALRNQSHPQLLCCGRECYHSCYLRKCEENILDWYSGNCGNFQNSLEEGPSEKTEKGTQIGSQLFISSLRIPYCASSSRSTLLTPSFPSHLSLCSFLSLLQRKKSITVCAVYTPGCVAFHWSNLPGAILLQRTDRAGGVGGAAHL